MVGRFKFLLCFCMIVISISSFAQKRIALGLNFTSEVITNSKVVAGVGIISDFKLNKHSGIESGLYYRTYKNTFDFTSNNTYYQAIVSERHISLPILYKFYSRILNFSVGPTFDFYLGWKQINTSQNFIIKSYTIDENFNIGVMGKLSKEIKISHRFFLEPEIRFNPIFTNRVYLGIGIAGKYLAK